jgi:N-acetyl-anhydromuramyl-L-alanine amidase AmpD
VLSQDYGPAEWHPADDHNYSGVKFREPISKIVVHVSGGSAASAAHTFQDPNREASYHYLIDFDGTPWQFVRERAVAYHCGWWNWNQRSIGVGLAGSLTSNNDKTDGMYKSLARLIARLSLKYDIPIDRKHIKGHYQAPGCSGNGGGFTCHTDPGEGFRWRFLLSQARKFRREMNS